jgi:phage baseplate assembly protein W
MSGDVAKKSGANAVKSAMLSLMKTNYNERLFQPEVGSGIRALLFEPMNPITEERLKQEVRDCLARSEPRAKVLGITVEGQEDKNRYKVSILFSVSTESEPQKLETFFEQG